LAFSLRRTIAASIACLCGSVACSAPTMVAHPAAGAPTPTSTRTALRAVDQAIGLVRDPAIAAALADIDPARIRHTDSMLVSFGTRNTFSDTLSTTRGI